MVSEEMACKFDMAQKTLVLAIYQEAKRTCNALELLCRNVEGCTGCRQRREEAAQLKALKEKASAKGGFAKVKGSK